MGSGVNGVVLHKLQLRGVTQLEGSAQLPPQVAPGGLQALDDLLHVALVQHADVNLRVAEIRGGVHRRDGHQAVHPGVFHGADKGGQLPLDLLVDASDAIARHNILLSRGLRPRSNTNGQAGLEVLLQLLQGVQLHIP